MGPRTRGARGDHHRAGRRRPGRLWRRPDGRHAQTGKYRRTRLIVLTLGYSRKAVRLLVWHSSTQVWAELHERAFRRLRGTVRMIVLDNPRKASSPRTSTTRRSIRSTAMCSRTMVQRTTETDYGLAAVKVPAEMIGKRVPGAMYEYYERFFEVRVPMSPEDARQRKDALRFLFRAHPSARTKARTFEENYEWKATISSPTSRVTQSYAVYVDVTDFAIWVVDSARGDVLAKTSLADLLKLKPR